MFTMERSINCGLGALLVRNSSAYTLQKKYFGGGTVEVALPSKKVHVLRKNLHERFEDGTINFLSIVALNHGLNSLKRLGLTMTMISNHSFTLAQYLHGKLLTMHHNNGQRAVKLYCDTDFSDEAIQGGIVNFNILRSDGSYIGYTEVINLASLHNISLRTGCFCNPGACLRHLGLSEDQYYDYYKAGHVCGDNRDLINGRPTGSVRVSFSYYTTYKNLHTLIDMLVNCFVTGPVIYKVPDTWEEEKYELRKKFKPYFNLNTFTHVKTTNYNGDLQQLKENGTDSIANNHPETSKDLTLSHIFIYPIKSCGCFEVFDTWNLDDKGLAFDRLWMITTSTGVALTQKQEPKMCLIKPVIDLIKRLMVLTFKGHPSISIPLDSEPSSTEVHSLCQSKVCTDYVQGVDCGDSVAEWLSKVLNKPGLRLIKQWGEEVRTKNKTDNVKLSLANQAQFLIITEASVGWLADQIQDTSSCSKESMLHRFRSNFVVQGKITAFGEQNWSQVHVGNNEFKVIGPCGRCQMICIDQETGDRTKEPLTILSASLKGKIKFGVYLSQIDSFKYSKISIGDKITSNFLKNNAFSKK
uniref:MOSC domain-containing protein n=1 Tax=Clastoptera arizonana TaxID=38151 RepID=A0A1B6ED13_9HEMI